MRQILLILLLIGLTLPLPGQKSRVVAVFQMIDAKNYEEAKESIELAAWHDKTSRWPWTYYAKGLLCQTAYEDGYEENDIKKTELYPDQLYVAYSAYEKALKLDIRERLHLPISQKYYYLSNHFRRLGEHHFRQKEYSKAFRAFEHALLISNSELVNAKKDTNLVYNTALAAYESGNWGSAIGYLTGLHDDAHTPGTTILLFKAHMHQGDSLRAEEVLREGLELYNYDGQVVHYLVNYLVHTHRMEMAIGVLNKAVESHPENYRFLWSRGLVYRRMGKVDSAVEDFSAASELNPQEPEIYFHLGIIYYNKGVRLREASLAIQDNLEYQKIKTQARIQFQEAVKWLEKSYELDPADEETISTLHHLYYQLQMREKEESIRHLVD